eukprot:TRINITY_DN33244_c0_g1_i1.p1 TRINITY_DN33244_c0_g1~~TRINITY_DN33244_c0_g1_i1.p1  ORF type:complete len:128 (+),score=13.26 TRINITY_DN33244_c0_g1_i1:19-402(+)
MPLDPASPEHLAEVEARFTAGETFVLNQIAEWCPDCTDRQRPALPAFETALIRGGLPLFTVCVQRDRGIYLSEAHSRLGERLGGAGYPRTLLVKRGQPAAPGSDLNRVEVMTEDALLAYAEVLIAAQ